MMNPLLPIEATISKVKEEFTGTYTLTMELPGPDLIQNFEPGKFNMIGLPGFGEIPVAFSDVLSETVGCHTVRVVGRVTKAITKLKKGDIIQIRGPYGHGWPFEPFKGHDLLLVMGGMGIIPLGTYMNHLIEKRDDFGEVTVLYGAKKPSQILFIDNVMQWQKKGNINVKLIVDEIPDGSEWKHEVGVVTDLLDHPSRGAPADIALICGPELMMRFVIRELVVRGMRPSNLYISMERHMKCGIGHCGHCQLGPYYMCKDGPILPYSKIRRLPDTLF